MTDDTLPERKREATILVVPGGRGRVGRKLECPECGRHLPVDAVTECDRCGAHLELMVKVVAEGVGEVAE